MDISLNDEQLEAAIRGAILTTITDEKRDELFQAAIKELLSGTVTVGHGHRSREENRFARAFTEAVERTTTKLALEIMEEEPYATQIRELVTKTLSEALAEGFDESVKSKLASAIADAIREGLRDRY